MPCIVCLYLLTSVQTLYIHKYMYTYIYTVYGMYLLYLYIYIYMLYIVFVTFIHSVHDFACFTLICYIKILNKKQNKYNYYKQILRTTSVRVSKKNQFSKRYKTRNNTFLLMSWGSVVKFKYFPPNIHHFCLSIVSHVMLLNKSNFWFTGSKHQYICFDANISCKLIFWRQ